MSKRSIELFELFKSKLNTLDQIRKKQESLFSRGHLARRDIEEVYAAIYVNAIASLEAFLEELFIGLLVGKIRSRRKNVKPKIKIRNYDFACKLIFREGRYFNWLPYKNTKELSRTFFAGGKPFTLITEDQEGTLLKCLITRNAIAHQSLHAIKRFKKEVLSNMSLIPRDRKPKGFLRSNFSSYPLTNYYEHYIIEILGIAKKLC
jgi:hypothetical protein